MAERVNMKGIESSLGDFMDKLSSISLGMQEITEYGPVLTRLATVWDALNDKISSTDKMIAESVRGAKALHSAYEDVLSDIGTSAAKLQNSLSRASRYEDVVSESVPLPDGKLSVEDKASIREVSSRMPEILDVLKITDKSQLSGMIPSIKAAVQLNSDMQASGQLLYPQREVYGMQMVTSLRAAQVQDSVVAGNTAGASVKDGLFSFVSKNVSSRDDNQKNTDKDGAQGDLVLFAQQEQQKAEVSGVVDSMKKTSASIDKALQGKDDKRSGSLVTKLVPNKMRQQAGNFLQDLGELLKFGAGLLGTMMAGWAAVRLLDKIYDKVKYITTPSAAEEVARAQNKPVTNMLQKYADFREVVDSLVDRAQSKVVSNTIASQAVESASKDKGFFKTIGDAAKFAGNAILSNIRFNTAANISTFTDGGIDSVGDVAREFGINYQEPLNVTADLMNEYSLRYNNSRIARRGITSYNAMTTLYKNGESVTIPTVSALPNAFDGSLDASSLIFSSYNMAADKASRRFYQDVYQEARSMGEVSGSSQWDEISMEDIIAFLKAHPSATISAMLGKKVVPLSDFDTLSMEDRLSGEYIPLSLVAGVVDDVNRSGNAQSFVSGARIPVSYGAAITVDSFGRSSVSTRAEDGSWTDTGIRPKDFNEQDVPLHIRSERQRRRFVDKVRERGQDIDEAMMSLQRVDDDPSLWEGWDKANRGNLTRDDVGRTSKVLQQVYQTQTTVNNYPVNKADITE